MAALGARLLSHWWLSGKVENATSTHMMPNQAFPLCQVCAASYCRHNLLHWSPDEAGIGWLSVDREHVTLIIFLT